MAKKPTTKHAAKHAAKQATKKKGKKRQGVHLACRIRVAFEGAISYMGTEENLSLCACPADARANLHGIPTFMQAGMTAYQHMLSGLWPGGSRDLSSTTPRRVHCPLGLGSAFARIGLISSDNTRQWHRGSPQSVGADDALARIKSLRVRAAYREARDADYCNEVRVRSATRGMATGVNFCGNTMDMLYEMKQMQHSYWAMFFARLWHIVNTLAVACESAYPAGLGFVWATRASGLSTVERGEAHTLGRRRAKAREEICMTAAYLVELVHVVNAHTPCAIRPWQGLNTHAVDMHEIEPTVDKVHIFASTSELSKVIPAEFTKTREVWLAIIEEMRRLRVYYQCAMVMSRMMHSFSVGGGVVCQDEIPIVVMAGIRDRNPKAYGYKIRTMEFRRVLETNQPLPCYVFAPFNNNVFTAHVALSVSESPYLYNHPSIFWGSIQLQAESLYTPLCSKPTAAASIRHGIATRSMIINACGPGHASTLLECMKQGSYEQAEFVGEHEFQDIWDLSKVSDGPGLTAAKTDRMQDFNRLDTKMFESLAWRIIVKDDLAFFLQAALTLNNNWLVQSRYSRIPVRTTEHTAMVLRMASMTLSKFIGAWAETRRLYRVASAAVAARCALERANVARAREAAKAQVIHEQACQKARQRAVARWRRSRAARVIQRRGRVFMRDTRLSAWARAHPAECTRRACLAERALVRGLERDRAATAIQSVYRSRWMGWAYDRAKWLALKLQARYRGARARYHYVRRRASAMAQAREKARAHRCKMEQDASEQHFHAMHNEAAAAHHRAAHESIVAYQHKVAHLSKQLRYLFEWERMAGDQYMMSHSLRDGTVPYELLLCFPCVTMVTCTVADPMALLLDAARCLLPIVVSNHYGLLHGGFLPRVPAFAPCGMPVAIFY